MALQTFETGENLTDYLAPIPSITDEQPEIQKIA